ncbi:hypothetical protein PHMEG_0009328 [Phytophthora megakarya]|uniref:Uncharacterized protein n=1 Tax=Phytophthora megakarya TaxID=4795 RepID=A0A225WHW4_9STRA|nr:hypothetical protein PHMEG_0009328 [Phytophthora megakarya]
MESAASAGSGSDLTPCSTVSSDEEWVAESSAEESSSASSSTSKKSRSVPARPYSVRGPVTENQFSTIAPPLKQTEFDSWEELESYLKEYTHGTYQLSSTHEQQGVSTKQQNHGDEVKSKQPKVPDAWVYYGKTFVCTHAGRYKSRGKGERKRQQSRMIECNAQV